MRAPRLLRIQVTPAKGESPRAVDEVRAEPGQGLEGDHRRVRALAEGSLEPGREVTLIEREALEALQRETGIAVDHAASRRNLLTEGVPLNHFVERTFRIGEVRLEGVRLCEPCGYLESKTAKGVVAGLMHRGGLRARVVEGGTLRVGDPIDEIG